MSEFIGKFSEVGLAVEASRGTAESSPSKCLKKTEANLLKNVNKTEDQAIVGSVVDINKLKKTQENYEGEISMNLHADAVGYLFNNIWGTVSTTELSVGEAYEHTFSLLESITRPSLTFFLKEGDVKQVKVPGCIVSSFTLSASQDAIVTGNFNIQGRSEESDTSSFTYNKEYDFIGKQLTLKTADTKSGLDGATAINVKSADLEIDTGAQQNYVADGNYSPNDIFQTTLNISLSLTLDYTDETFHDLYDGDGNKFVRLTIEDPDTDIGGGNYPKVEVDLYKCFVEDWERSSGQGDVVTQDVTLRATYNQTEDTVGQAVVVNTTASSELSS